MWFGARLKVSKFMSKFIANFHEQVNHESGESHLLSSFADESDLIFDVFGWLIEHFETL